MSDLSSDLVPVRQALTDLSEKCRKIGPHVFIGITEYNRMEYSCVNLQSALYAAEFIEMCSEMPLVKNVMIWNDCSLNFGLRCASFNYKRPQYFVYEMMKELRDRNVPVTVSASDPDVKVLATKNSMSDEVSLLITNLDATAKKMTFAAKAGSHLILLERQFINGNDLGDSNENGEKIVLQTQPINKKTSEVEIPGYSVTLIKATVAPVKK
jgi:hypothetical protein